MDQIMNQSDKEMTEKIEHLKKASAHKQDSNEEKKYKPTKVTQK